MLHVPARRRARHPRPRPDVRVAAALARMRLAIGRRSTSFLRRKSPISRIPVCRRLTTRGRWRPATANAPSYSGPMSARLPKIRSSRVNAEDLARKALSDGNLLRRERRLAWRAERRIGAEGATAHDGIDESASAALLESLLLKDMMTWSQGLPPPT